MKVSLNDVIVIKNYAVKGVWCTKAVEWISQEGLETWKLEASIVCWRESVRRVQLSDNQTAADSVRCVATRTLRRCRTSWSVGRTSQNAPIRQWDFAWNWHFPFECAQDNSPWSPAQMLQTTSCSAVI